MGVGTASPLDVTGRVTIITRYRWHPARL